MRSNHPETRYLKSFFWTALVLLFIGGTVALLLSLDKTDTTARLTVRVTLLLTGAAVVLCVICATSDWWLKR
ncbi:MAG: hypothetical protein KKC51_02620 [Verrucomicrobia bacterium]|nr:hypothetical protein [Verrucomicrobiota bacterium]